MTTPRTPVRFGIAGLGTAGTALIPPVLRNPAFRLTGAADLDADALTAFRADFPEARTFNSVEAMAASDAVDVMFIATPTHLHTGHVLAAINGGKHVVTEKPVATNLEDADRMIEAADKAGVVLMVGHSFGYETPIKEIRRVVKSGELGPLKMLHNWYYTDWIYRPRNPEELDTRLGGGVTFRQGSHQFDIIRYIAGGKARSVRAMTGRWDAGRPAEGAHTVYLEFEDGVAATAVYSGYDRFFSAELTYPVAENGRDLDLSNYGAARKALREAKEGGGEATLKRGARYGASRNRGTSTQAPPNHPFYGLLVVSCELGDVRQSPDGLLVYGPEEKREVDVPKGTSGRDNILTELLDALNGRPPLHDGRWGKANLEVCLAVLESARERKEVHLSHQKAVND